MNTDFSESRTKINLMKSFAGECQARERYNISASFALKEKLYIINKAFLTISDQEKEHGEVFYDFLKPFSNQSIKFDADYPVDLFDSTLEFLRKASKNEISEFEDIYDNFGKIAKEEGFLDISKKFFEIAAIEKTHSEKFSKLASCLESGTLFKSSTPTSWICLKCGRVHFGTEAPEICPVCGHDIGYYLRNDLISCIS